MADKKTGEENIRKIQRTGKDGASYMVTLPKRIIKRLDWREHRKVVIQEEDGRIVIEDWED